MNGGLNYCDSKWYATDYANDTIVVRVNTPTKINSSVQPNANITVTPFSHMYAGVRYRANGTLQQARVERNVAHTFIAPSANFTDTETAIYGASQISSIGDLSPLYCNYCDVSKAEKLIELKLGSEDAAYDSQLTKLSLGTNRLLKRLDIRNCKSFASSVNLSGCANIEEVYAEGSSITSVSLADSGYLKVLHLPNTITVLKITNQQFIEDFQFAGYEALDTLHIENVPGLPIGDILNGATNLNWVRLINVEWESTPEELEATFIKLKECGGIDANDHTAEKAVVSGIVKVPDISRELLAEINDVFPELMVSVDGVVLCTVKYYNYNGDVLYTTTVPRGTNAPDIVADELIDYIPSRPQTDEYRYEYKGWSDSLENIQRSKSFIAMYNVFYGVRFFNDGNEAYRVYVPYGTELEDPIPNHIAEPTKAQTVSHTYTYVGWDKDISNIVEPLVVNAVFHEALRQYEITFRNEGEEEPLEVKMVDYGTYPVYTGAAPVKQGVTYPQDYAFIGWTPSIDGVKGDTTYTAKFADSDHILDNWKAVKANIANGTYKDKYPIGILQRVTLATGEEIDVELVGYDHDSTESGATTALTFIAKKLPSTTYRMADANVGTIGGWKDCDMRRFLNDEFIELLPSDLRSVITPVVKYASTGAGAANSANSVIPVIDTLWLPSITEVCAHYYTSDNKLYSAEGKPYDLYAPYTMDTPAAQAIRKKVTVNSVSQVKYWLRTPVYMNGSIYYAINIDGAANAFTRIEKACHIAFGFCIN